MVGVKLTFIYEFMTFICVFMTFIYMFMTVIYSFMTFIYVFMQCCGSNEYYSQSKHGYGQGCLI